MYLYHHTSCIKTLATNEQSLIYRKGRLSCCQNCIEWGKETCSNSPVQVKVWLILTEEIQEIYCIS